MENPEQDKKVENSYLLALNKKPPRVPRISKAVIVRDSLFGESLRILEEVNSTFGSGDAYLDAVMGPKITQGEAQLALEQYMKREGLEAQVSLKWSSKICCSACLLSPRRINRLGRNRFTFMINSTEENLYLRERAILCLADHEIGTHLYRSRNEGFQLWYQNRKKYHLSVYRKYPMLLAEEGLATLNTHLKLDCKLLWKPALHYYAACMARTMDPIELHSHLGCYIADKRIRDKLVYRVKRDTGRQCGGSPLACGWDQCYFIGAMNLLQRLDTLDLPLLHSGKLTADDLERVKRISRMSVLKLPTFLNDLESYVSALREIKSTNHL